MLLTENLNRSNMINGAVQHTFGEVEREGWLVCAEVVDVKEELVGEVLLAPLADTAYAGVDEVYLWPLTLMLLTSGSRKSHSCSG